MEIVTLDEDTGRFVSDPQLRFDHPYPCTKLMFAPDKECQHEDLMATTGDFLRIWKIDDDLDGAAMEKAKEKEEENENENENANMNNNNNNNNNNNSGSSKDRKSVRKGGGNNNGGEIRIRRNLPRLDERKQQQNGSNARTAK